MLMTFRPKPRFQSHHGGGSRRGWKIEDKGAHRSIPRSRVAYQSTPTGREPSANPAPRSASSGCGGGDPRASAKRSASSMGLYPIACPATSDIGALLLCEMPQITCPPGCFKASTAVIIRTRSPGDSQVSRLRRSHGSKPGRDNDHAEAISVHPAKQFHRGFGYPVVAIRVGCWLKHTTNIRHSKHPDRVDRTGEQHAAGTGTSSCFEKNLGAVDIEFGDVGPGALLGVARKMNNKITAGEHSLQSRSIKNRCGNKGFTRG